MEALNKHQQDALERAYDLLGEHFDHAVIITGWDVDSTAAMAYKLIFKGGSLSALGLCNWAADRILDQDRKGSSNGQSPIIGQ